MHCIRLQIQMPIAQTAPAAEEPLKNRLAFKTLLRTVYELLKKRLRAAEEPL